MQTSFTRAKEVKWDNVTLHVNNEERHTEKAGRKVVCVPTSSNCHETDFPLRKPWREKPSTAQSHITFNPSQSSIEMLNCISYNIEKFYHISSNSDSIASASSHSLGKQSPKLTKGSALLLSAGAAEVKPNIDRKWSSLYTDWSSQNLQNYVDLSQISLMLVGQISVEVLLFACTEPSSYIIGYDSAQHHPGGQGNVYP